jgi:hypothetical protein
MIRIINSDEARYAGGDAACQQSDGVQLCRLDVLPVVARLSDPALQSAWRLPCGRFVPEPMRWAMMIAGFGLVGPGPIANLGPEAVIPP